MKALDIKKREDHILDLIIDSYIEESHPIGSSYLCGRYNLPYSSATVRNVMGNLEKKGYLAHLHTSSGRIPTRAGFKHYVKKLKNQQWNNQAKETLKLIDIQAVTDMSQIFETTLDVLSNITGYTSLIGVRGIEDGVFLKGARFIFDQPEFDDIDKLRNIFYALEVKIDQLQEVLFEYIDEQDLQILIGDDIGFEEISECSLLVSGLKEKDCSIALALLGPMRMNYEKACSNLFSVTCNLDEVIRRLL